MQLTGSCAILQQDSGMKKQPVCFERCESSDLLPERSLNYSIPFRANVGASLEGLFMAAEFGKTSFILQ